MQALTLIKQEEKMMSQYQLQDDLKPAADAAFVYLKYIVSTWLDAALWYSWSKKGKEYAAAKSLLRLYCRLQIT